MRSIKPAPVRRSLEVRASAERAFDVFTRMGSWWPPSHTISKGKLKTVIIEPYAGGRWYGEDEDGSTTDWGRVLAFERPSRLLLAWQIGADWRFDPDLVTEVELHFTPLGEASTRVEFEHRHLERLGSEAEKLRQAFESSEWLERHPRPVRRQGGRR